MLNKNFNELVLINLLSSLLTMPGILLAATENSTEFTTKNNESSGGLPELVQDSEEINLTNTTDESVTLEPVENFGELSKKICLHYHPPYDYEGRFIIGGSESLSREFPHMAAIGYETKEGVQWKCGGSLISKKFVLTAGHCISHKGSLPKFVRLGDLDLVTDKDDASPQNFTIVKATPHPLYDPPAKYHDIALLELDREANFSPYVRPACLHTENETNYRMLYATGWGRTGHYDESSTHLLKVNLELISNSNCSQAYIATQSKSYLPQGILDDGQICAAGYRGRRDTCEGDSGGPLQAYRYTEVSGEDKSRTYVHDHYWAILGITSFGRPCGISGAPSVYTRVSNYVPWIESIAFQSEM